MFCNLTLTYIFYLAIPVHIRILVIIVSYSSTEMSWAPLLTCFLICFWKSMPNRSESLNIKQQSQSHISSISDTECGPVWENGMALPSANMEEHGPYPTSPKMLQFNNDKPNPSKAKQKYCFGKTELLSRDEFGL